MHLAKVPRRKALKQAGNTILCLSGSRALSRAHHSIFRLFAYLYTRAAVIPSAYQKVFARSAHSEVRHRGVGVVCLVAFYTTKEQSLLYRLHLDFPGHLAL